MLKKIVIALIYALMLGVMAYAVGVRFARGCHRFLP
jgi:hypothetical protein